MTGRVICLTDDVATRVAWLPRCAALHAQLRPAIPGDYVDYLERMFTEGAEMAVLVDDEDTPCALALFRMVLSTSQGRRFRIDDLVTDEARRGAGWGGRMMDWLEARAREKGCATLALESGTARTRAHRFYFDKGLVISSFSFVKPLG